MLGDCHIELNRWPTEEDWMQVKERALITTWKSAKNPPDANWKHRILEARHSPIRYLMYGFTFKNIPSNTATHFVRHVHAQPYVSSLRNDRQEMMDGDAARRDTPVNMILDVNGEELMVMANKRLCNCAAKDTRRIMEVMCSLVLQKTPEYDGLLVPMCDYHGGVCHEMFSCGRLNHG